jgi:drug/metabolite transporter (DMT)-like permease
VTAAELAGGVVLAAGAAACFDGAVALQALEARALPTDRIGAGFVRGLLKRRRWLAATGLAVLGWPLQIGALALAPLTVVQPTLALGVVLLLYLGHRMLGEPVRPRDLAAIGAIVVGIALLAWAAPAAGDVQAGDLTVAIVIGGLGLVAAAPWTLPRRPRGTVLVIAAGCGFAASGIASKLLADALHSGTLSAVALWIVVTAAVAGLGMVDDMAALQTVVAARAAGGAFALETALPVLLAPIVVGEEWGGTPLGGGVILLGLALVLGGAAVLGSTGAVSRLASAR